MAEVMEKSKAEPKAEPKKYRITFHGEGGNVEIGANFKLNSYPRNVETVITQPFLEALKLAVIETVVEDSEGKRKAVRIPCYSYTLEGEA